MTRHGRLGRWGPVGAVLLLVAALDRADEEVLGLLVAVTVGAALLGWLRPARTWRWGLLVGLSVPAAESMALLLGQHAPAPPDPAGSVVALVPAFAGAYLGSMLGRWMAPAADRAARDDATHDP